MVSWVFVPHRARPWLVVATAVMLIGTLVLVYVAAEAGSYARANIAQAQRVWPDAAQYLVPLGRALVGLWNLVLVHG
jgi:hypothetical protein